MEAGLRIDLVERHKAQPVNQWVYDVLWANIIQLHLNPGDAVSENEIASALKVSRTPVREAFIRLVKDGLLEVIPQKGSLVSRIDLGQAQDARFVRIAVEKMVLAAACVDFPKDGYELLTRNIENQESLFRAKSFDRFLAADNDFHRMLYAGCGRESVWTEIICKLDFNYDRLRVLSLPSTSHGVIDQHREILEVVSKKQAARIEKVVERHLTWEVIVTLVTECPDRFFKK